MASCAVSAVSPGSGPVAGGTVVSITGTNFVVGSTTVVPGWAHPGENPYRLHRLRVLGGTTGEQLLALVDGARDEPPAPTSFTTP